MKFELRPFRQIPETLVDWTRWMKAQKIPQSGISLGLTVTAVGDMTPSVLDASFIELAGGTAISNFDDGKVGQVIRIRAELNTSIGHGTNIVLNGAANFDMIYDDTLTLGMFDQDIWLELSRSVNT